MKKLFSGLFLVMFIIAGCATPYQRKGFKGGYSDFRIDANTFRVQFTGNAHTSQETVEVYAFYRCAEVTLNAGFDYFLLVGERGEVYRQTAATPGFYQSRYHHGRFSSFYIPSQFIQTTKHGSFVTIKAFNGQKPQGEPSAYDAREVIKYLGQQIKMSESYKGQQSNFVASKAEPPSTSSMGDLPSGPPLLSPKLNDYYSMLWPKIKEKWQFPKNLHQGKTDLEAIIVIVIGREGNVQQTWFEKNSGNHRYDEDAITAIRKAEPFPPLPKELGNDTLKVGIRFHLD